MWNQSVAYLYLYIYMCVSWHLLNCHHLSVSHLTITIRFSLSLSLSLSLSFSLLFYPNVIDFFSSSLFLFINCRFTAMWPLPLADQVFLLLLLLLLHSSSNNNHTHLILTRLSMIDGLTGGLHAHIYIYIYLYVYHCVVLIFLHNHHHYH